ncbi:hypothetical protein LINGRAHAP2_LOCUS30538, partial [Linum grandiflorum]
FFSVLFSRHATIPVNNSQVVDFTRQTKAVIKVLHHNLTGVRVAKLMYVIYGMGILTLASKAVMVFISYGNGWKLT